MLRRLLPSARNHFMRTIGRPSALTSAITLVVATVVALVVAVGLPPRAGTPGPPAVRALSESGTTLPPRRPAVTRQSDGPNVVLITTDDQTLSDMRWMPRTRAALGSRGATFTDMLSPHPLCCPARAEILTGQYAQNNGVHSNGGRYGGFPALKAPQNTLATWLARGGYHTGMVGKFLNNYRPDTDGMQVGWESWSVAADNKFGYDDFTLYTNGVTERYARDEGFYSSDVVTEQTTDLIDRWRGDDQPFFIWSSYYAPHGLCSDDPGCDDPPLPAPRHRTVPASTPSPHLAKPSYRAALDHPNPFIAGRAVQPRAEMQRIFQQRIRSLQAVDEGVQQIVEVLGAAGELDDTLVIFTSDNGYLVGEHRFEGKVLPYREALAVPLLMRGPGIPAGVRRNRTVTTVDLAPTIVAATGVAPGRRMDGRTILGVARHGRALRGNTVLIQAGPESSDRTPRPWAYRGVRTTRFTYTRWPETRFRELYDRRVDPFEVHNVASDRRYHDVVRELDRRLQALGDCQGVSDCFRDFSGAPRPRSR